MDSFLLAVNFHYVGMPDHPYPGIHGLSVDGFREALRTLARHFEMVGPADLLRWLDAGKMPRGRFCLVTFDDGLACQEEHAVPVLERERIPAAFFVISGPRSEQRAAGVHKLHWVRAHTEPRRMAVEIAEAYHAVTGLDADLDRFSDDVVLGHLVHDDLETARVKYFMHFGMDAETNAAVIERLFARHVEDEPDFVDRFYMSYDCMRQIHDRWRGIGGHGVSHRPIATLDADRAKQEFTACRAFLERVVDAPVSAFSYPHGGVDAVGLREGALAEKAGFRFAFTMERGLNFSMRQPLLLARIDANEIPGGKSPVFEFSDAEVRLLDERYSLRRARYPDGLSERQTGTH